MCGELVSCADFRAILTPFSEVIWNRRWPDVTPQIDFSSKVKVEFESALTTRPSTGGKCTFTRQNLHFPPVEGCVVSAQTNSNKPIRVEGKTTLRAAVVASRYTSVWGKPKRRILRQIFRSSAAEAHVFGVKFIGLNIIVVFIAIRDFACWGESDLWSDVWPAMDGVVCLSILLEGRVAVSNNFTKRRRDDFKLGTRDK